LNAHHAKKSTGDRVSLVGIALGIGSFGLRFVQYKPNRIATGEGLFAWQVLTPPQLLPLVLPWILSLVLLYTLREEKSRSYLLAVLDRVMGNVAVIAVFLSIGRVTASLISAE